jgi:N-carbamoyl-L-amino-acid hydrolase
MINAGCDEVKIDAVGNVVGIYYAHNTNSASKPLTLLTGSHYDTVRNAGRYDGRLGIYLPLASVQQLHLQQKRLPYHLEIVAFAEEEGQRYAATFLGSGALTGHFPDAWLSQQDASGISMQQAMHEAGLNPAEIPLIKRDPKKYIGFVEAHIEQGPVLNEMNLALGVVHSINASVRYKGKVLGMASHAGTTPMKIRKDAAMAVAELMLFAEQTAQQGADLVATVGILNVPNGSINVVPGLCEFSLDIRAPSDTQRDQLASVILAKLDSIVQKRGLSFELNETMRASAAPSNPSLQQYIADAVASVGLPIFTMPSGAGHDAMKLHDIMPQAMLFVRGENSGISHNPLESTSNDDIELALQSFDEILQQVAKTISNEVKR